MTQPGQTPNRVRTALQGGGPSPHLVPYLMAGFPKVEDTSGLLLAAQSAGATLVELGLPYSDPLADGPTIQAAGQRALAQGMTVRRALRQVAEARGAGLTIPLIVMTYLNPVLRMGLEEFAEEAALSGVDGLLLPDLPLEEMGELSPVAARFGLALNTMVAPTTPDQRLSRAAELSSGFIYCVSRTGVTGSKSTVGDEARVLLTRARALTAMPLALGFGLRRREQIRELSGLADAVVVGSLLLEVAGVAADPAAAIVEALGALSA